MTTVSIQEVRFEFGKVRRALERGEESLLTFRNRPLIAAGPNHRIGLLRQTPNHPQLPA